MHDSAHAHHTARVMELFTEISVQLSRYTHPVDVDFK